jgi:hypothetical protein
MRFGHQLTQPVEVSGVDRSVERGHPVISSIADIPGTGTVRLLQPISREATVRDRRPAGARCRADACPLFAGRGDADASMRLLEICAS